MNRDLIFALIRHLLTFVGSLLVTKGVIDAGQAETVVGAAVSLAGVIWSVLDKKKLADAAKAGA